jgi:hypothetical protein
MSARTRPPRLTDHTQLPAEDGAIVHNFEELKQSILLTDCLEPQLERLHPDGRYCIGQDTGIYWRLPAPGEPPGQARLLRIGSMCRLACRTSRQGSFRSLTTPL